MSRHRIFTTAALVVVAFSLLTTDVLARHHYGRGGRGGGSNGRARMIAMLNAQVAYAQAVQRDAEARAAVAQGAVDSANDRISSARTTLESATSDERKIHADLVSMESELIQTAGEDSEIAKAKKKLDETRAAVQEYEKRVLTSTEYLDKVKESVGTPEHAALVPKIRHEMLSSDNDYQRAFAQWETARQEYNRLRTEMVTKDEKWQGRSAEIKEAWTAERKAENDGIAGGMKKLPAKQTLHEAQRTAAEARAFVMQGQAMLRALGGNQGRGGKPNTPIISSSTQ